MKYFAFRNVQKCYAVIIDIASDPKISSVSDLSANFPIFLKFSKFFEIFQDLKLYNKFCFHIFVDPQKATIVEET